MPIPARLGLYGFMEGQELTTGVKDLDPEVIQEVQRYPGQDADGRIHPL